MSAMSLKRYDCKVNMVMDTLTSKEGEPINEESMPVPSNGYARNYDQ